MDFYEPLPEFDANGIFLDFEDRRNGIDEWIEGEFTEWMCSRCLSVITDGEYEVVRMLFGLSDCCDYEFEQEDCISDLPSGT